MQQLSKKKCIPCEGKGVRAMKITEAKKLMVQIPSWKLLKGKIVRVFLFADFKKAMVFISKVAKIAEAEGHHPDIMIQYNKVTLELFTHSIKGLHENDFILASKINQL